MTQASPTFFQELKRRRVVRVAMVYGGVAFAVLEGADMVFPRLGFPDWTVTLVMMLAIFGFPVALVLSWVFDITPGGVERTESVEEGATPPTGWPMVALLACALVGAGAAGVTLVVLDSATVRTVSTEGVADELLNTVAVLPFTTIGTDRASLDFAAGLHGDLTTQLTKVRDLRVTSQTSVVQYAGTDKTIPVIAEELGVLVILEGVVQRSGEHVRIQAQLIDGRTDEHLWADTYDREFTVSNVFAIQSDIASTIAAALKATLTEEERRTIEAVPTESEAAYAAYLAAMAHWPSRLNGEDARAFLARLEEAVSIDPNFGLAWARLAEARSWLVFRNLAGADEWERALAAEAEAVRIAPGAPETRMAAEIRLPPEAT
jgi:TolB-like protein